MKNKELKLKDILEQDATIEDKVFHLGICKNNVEREIILVEGEINKMNLHLNKLYRVESDKFSGSEIYNQRQKIVLMEKKLEGLKKILTDLF